MTSEAQTTNTTTTTTAATRVRAYATFAESLVRVIVDETNPNPDRANDVLSALRGEWTETMRELSSSSSSSSASSTSIIELLGVTSIGVVLSRTVRSCKRHGRTSDERTKWDEAVRLAGIILSSMKEAAANEEKTARVAKKSSASSYETVGGGGVGVGAEGPPSSTADFRARLVRQGKELYKDPPSLPPPGGGRTVTVQSTIVSTPPTRNASTGGLTFVAGYDADENLRSLLLRDFHPNRTPEEVLRAGSFGGTYFRAITSAVTNVRYSSSSALDDTVDPDWIAGLDKSTMLASSVYRPSINKYGVKCGGSLGMWESSGWISDADPYGWFQWYCRFYAGRRCSDDARQIGRWMGVAGRRGRFRSQLCNRIIAAKATANDASISPVIRQTLLPIGDWKLPRTCSTGTRGDEKMDERER
ncbi:hypothetical protein ACHAXA_007395 [Cyclostephanos tholiformis]|uniref:Uncharacterized protein n=1 Tax=Cyclostephanos tholiformis TaxID=382380 RepID=A0ABD3RE82_9STRA